jgi:hypothetical protein
MVDALNSEASMAVQQGPHPAPITPLFPP